MSSNFYKLVVLVFFLVAGTRNVPAQIYSQHIVGYVNSRFIVGSNLFNNPLQSGSNTLTNLFQIRFPPPEGTSVSLWSPTNSSFDTTATYTNGSWSTNLSLPPGTGALVFAPSPFTNTIAGYLLNHDGSPLTNDPDLHPPLPPPIFSGPAGVYLLGDKCPVVNNTGTNIFLNIIGRMPYFGEQVASLTSTSTYLGNGAWDSVPTLGVGEAAFFTILPEPPPLLAIVCSINQAIVSWPSEVSGWTLQTNDNLTAGTWGNYAGPIINNVATNSLPRGNIFFRLSHP